MNYFDIPANLHNQARISNAIPDWFTRFSVEERWINFDEYTQLDTSDPRIVIEMRYFHRGGRCYQIREYCVYDWTVTIRTGTVCHFLRVDVGELNRSERVARRFLLRSTLDALGNYANPTNSVVAGLVDLGVMAAGSALPPILSDLASGWDMSQLFDNVQTIVDQVEPRLRAIARLRALDGTKIATHTNVVFVWGHKQIKTFSSVDVVEVQCADWILKIPEGEAVAMPAHNELIYPLRPLDAELENDLRNLREFAAPSGLAPAGGRERIRRLVDRLQPGDSPGRDH